MKKTDFRPMDEVVAEVGQLTRAMRGQLRGPEVQAAALADLVSTWIAGWLRYVRAHQWSNFLDLVDDLRPIAGKTVFNADLVGTGNQPGQDGYAWGGTWRAKGRWKLLRCRRINQQSLPASTRRRAAEWGWDTEPRGDLKFRDRRIQDRRSLRFNRLPGRLFFLTDVVSWAANTSLQLEGVAGMGLLKFMTM